MVRLGDTTVICGVKAEIAEPELDRPDEGFLGEYICCRRRSRSSHRYPVPNIDLPAICSPKFKPGPPTEEAQVLSDRLNQALAASVFPVVLSPLETTFSRKLLFSDLVQCHYLLLLFIRARPLGCSMWMQRV